VKTRHLARLAAFGLKTILFRLKKPILGTIIVTDYCNLNCRHCAVNNINRVMHSFSEIANEMRNFYDEGIRILFLSGGETMLWHDGEHDVHDLIAEGRRIGFYLINIVTNGTVTLDVPDADLVFLSLDGMRETNDEIRGQTYDTVMANLERSGDTNICLYTAINALNVDEIEALADLARDHPRISAISFNFHTPYRLTESLCLTAEQRECAVRRIGRLIDRRYPVFNLRSVLKLFLRNTWARPCHQCIVSEDRVRYVCGRCSEIPGLCEQCGYLFAAEFSAIFSGNLRAIVEMFRTYVRYA
jgi:MoaA/NifB/PqqE/SkfB family radical SAM enzyme